MKKYEVQIAGYGYGYEVEEGAIDIRFKDGAEITYSQVNPHFGTECILDATRIFDFD